MIQKKLKYLYLLLFISIPQFLCAEDVITLDIETAIELALENNVEWLRKYVMPTHPNLDELVERLTAGDIDAMLNWEKGNPHNYNFLAWLRGEIKYPLCTIPTLGIWGTGDLPYLLEQQMLSSENYMAAAFSYKRHECNSHWQQVDEPERVNRYILEWLGQTQ